MTEPTRASFAEKSENFGIVKNLVFKKVGFEMTKWQIKDYPLQNFGGNLPDFTVFSAKNQVQDFRQDFLKLLIEPLFFVDLWPF